MHHIDDLPVLVAEADGERIGLAAYDVRGDECELVALVSTVHGRGAGLALIAAVRDAARAAGCRRLWLITTNDNTPALRWYQRHGWDLVAVHHDAVTTSRRLKPEIPETGLDGIPLRHELELELPL